MSNILKYQNPSSPLLAVNAITDENYAQKVQEMYRLRAEADSLGKRYTKADSLGKEIAMYTLRKYIDRNGSALNYGNWAGTIEAGEPEDVDYLIDHNIRIEDNDVVNFLQSYVNSEGFSRIRNNQINWWKTRHPYQKYLYPWALNDKKYINRYINAINDYGDKMLNYTLDGYPSMSFSLPNRGSSFTYRRRGSDDKEHPYFETQMHEFDHLFNVPASSLGTINSEVFDQNTNTKKNSHDEYRDEKHSDNLGVKYLLFKEGIYDARGNKDITPEQVQQLRNKYPKLRFLQQLNNEDAAFQINHIAQNTTDSNHIGYREPITFAKKGGRIHIKKKNRGSFTRWCKGKVTEECIRRGKNSPNPAIRKKATFAANARKWKHENGGILKAQEGTGNLLTPHPLSPVGIALNQARAMSKGKKDQQHLPPGVKEVVGPDGKKVAIRTEQPLVPLEQNIAEWLPGTGDIAEVGYITNDVKNGNYGSAALTAGLIVLPGNVGKLLSKHRKAISKTADAVEDAVRRADISEYINTVDDALPERQPLTIQKSSQFWDGTSKSNLTHEEKLGIPKGERSYYKQSLGKSKISPEEKSGVPKGERNNGKYKGITFFRSSHEVPQLDENGFAILTDPDNWFLNTTTDGLLHTHYGYPYLRNHVYAIDPEAFRGSTLFSTEPSDMFFLNSSVKVKPKHIIFISGDDAALKEAAALGYQTMTSPQLKIGFKRSRFGGDYRLKQYDYHNDLRNFVSAHFSRPTISAYEKISEQTMLPVAVKPFTGKNFVPTGKGVNWSKSDFRHVVYDPASPIEYQFKKQIGLPHWGRSFDSRSLWQRLIQQNRLQDAAKQIQPLKTGGKL